MGIENYLQQSLHNLKPVFDFIEPVTTGVKNFLTSGEAYDPNVSATSNLIQSFQTPSNLFEDNWMSDDMDLTFGGGDVPSASGYTTTINDGIDWASADPWHEMGPPINNLTATGSGAVTQRPWKQDEIDINAVGTLNSGDRGYDSVGNLKEGWALGIDGIPYNRALFALNDAAIAAGSGSGSGGGGGGGSVPSEPVLNTRMPLNRTPSGSVYAPDLSAYNNSSLFNYTGPGGASEYTYGQDLPYQGAGYGIWGSPTDVANPYFWGQFANAEATGAATGPADAAINMPSVEMPAGVPSTNTTTSTGGGNVGGGGTGPGGKDLTYQETLDYFNLNPYAQSTTFPSPGGSNQSLFDRQLAEMSPEQIARMNQILADEHRMQQGQLVNDKLTEEQRLNKDVKKTQPISWIDMGNNYGVGDRGGITSIGGREFYDDVAGGEWDAANNFNRSPIFESPEYTSKVKYENNYDLGRPGDPSYEEFVANPALFTTATRGDGSDNESFDNPILGNDTVSATPYVGNAGRGTIVEEPGMRALNSTPQLDEIVQNYKTDQNNRNMFRNSVLYPQTTIEGSPAYGGLDGFPGEFGLHNQEPYNKAAFDFAGMPSERSIWKGDEIDIQTPFRPAGVEGEDFYEGNDGKFYATHDDLGLEPLAPTENKPNPLYSIPEQPYGTIGANNVASDYADFAGTGVQTRFFPERIIPSDGVEPNPLYQIPDRTYGDVNANNVTSDYAGFEGTRNMPSVYDLPADSYEREVYLGQIPAESTSDILSEEEFNDSKGKFINIIKEGFESMNLPEKPAWQSSTVKDTDVFPSAKDSDMTMEVLEERFMGIESKYEGSTTDTSKEAELGEIINAIASSYSTQDEGTDTGELSTRDLINPSLIYTSGGRATGGEAREGQRSGRGDGLGQALKNQAIIASIFNKPDVPVIRSEPSLFVPNNFQAQIKPSVAKTQNNMTVPTSRDAALTKRYGQPYRRYGL